jgi:hypothetical protein
MYRLWSLNVAVAPILAVGSQLNKDAVAFASSVFLRLHQPQLSA